MTGQFEDLQSKVSGMSAGVSSTFEGMQGKMTGMSAGMSAGMSSTFESLQGKAWVPAVEHDAATEDSYGFKHQLTRAFPSTCAVQSKRKGDRLEPPTRWP